MKLAIIGAGWAGLAAAVRAADLQHQVTVFEAAHTLGGRARGVSSRRLGLMIDNGQHILLGAYTETLHLMQRLEVDLADALLREPLRLEAARGDFHLRIARAPAPLHLGLALLRARGLSLAEKWHLLRTLRTLQTSGWRTPAGMTVQQWLEHNAQSAHVQQRFWIPLCLAALNTPVHTACAQIFATVLRDSLGGRRSASDSLLPRVNLSALWPDRVETLVAGNGHITVRRGQSINHIGLEPAAAGNGGRGQLCIADESFDGLILACNVPSTLRLLRGLPGTTAGETAALLQTLASYRYHPIVTVTLHLERPWELPCSMYMLEEDRPAGDFGQWLFHAPSYMVTASQNVPDDDPVLLHIVISDAGDALELPAADLVAAVSRQVRVQLKRFGPMPPVIGHDLIAEKRAGFAATPGLQRPASRTPWPNIWLAGDWTDTGYPAVLEGAVRSGRKAAEAAHESVQ